MIKIYRSNRIERLIDALAFVLKKPLKSLTEPELIGIHSRGLRAWLATEMSERLGVWAHVKILFPRDLINALLEIIPKTQIKSNQQQSTIQMTWCIMALLARQDTSNRLDSDGFESLKAYLKTPDQSEAQSRITDLKRFQLAQKIASLFDQYLIHRPEMILEWENQPADTWRVKAENRWQPLLWRALSKISTEMLGSDHLAAKVDRLVKMLRSGGVSAGVFPERISLFGIAALPPLYMNVFSALSELTEINLFILSPSEEYWSHIRSQREIIRQLGEYSDDPDLIKKTLHFEEGNFLLATLGHLGRDFQNMLEMTDYEEPYDDLHEDPMMPQYYAQSSEDANLKSVITVLQSDILNLRQRRIDTETAPLSIDQQDLSVTVHSCHSPLREAEVLYDLLLNLFDSDPALNPDDVIVMMPDIEPYAPFIDAVFGGDADEPPLIPYSISDRSLRQETAVVDVFLAIINLAQTRVTVQEVLDILSADVVLEKFQLEPQDIETVRQWLSESGIRWGIDRNHRQAVNQPDFNENTWRFGLDRLLLGYAMPGDGQTLFQAENERTVLPYDEMEGEVTQVLGRAAHFCELLFDIIRKLSKPHTMQQWRDLLRTILSEMIMRTEDNEFWHKTVRDMLDDMAAQASAAVSSLGLPDEALDLNIINRLLSKLMAKTPSSQGFLQGGVTFCNLLSMRCIPFRIICLMGMNDGRFPRFKPAIGFDLMAQNPKMGDRSLRDDDRYLFLETLLSVREKLIITYCGQDVQTNDTIGPSVVVSELLDEIEQSFILHPAGGDADSIKDYLITKHPLQPYSPKYFRTDIPELFSYSRLNCESAQALIDEAAKLKSFITHSLKPSPEKADTINLDDLIYFFRMPARFFLSHQFGIYLGDTKEEVAEREPFQLNPLEMYPLGQSLLEQAVKGYDPDNFFPLMRAKGALPLGTPGKIAYHKIVNAVDPVATAVLEAISGKPLEPAIVDINFDNIRLYGKIDALWPEYRVQFRFASIKPANRLALWIKHLALNCSPDSLMPTQSILFGKKAKNYDSLVFNAIAEDDAKELLADLIAIYQQGQVEPLRFFPSTSYAYAEKICAYPNKEAAAMTAARKAWSPYNFEGEDVDPSVKRVFGKSDPLEERVDNPDMKFKNLAVRVFKTMIQQSKK